MDALLRCHRLFVKTDRIIQEAVRRFGANIVPVDDSREAVNAAATYLHRTRLRYRDGRRAAASACLGARRPASDRARVRSRPTSDRRLLNCSPLHRAIEVLVRLAHRCWRDVLDAPPLAMHVSEIMHALIAGFGGEFANGGYRLQEAVRSQVRARSITTGAIQSVRLRLQHARIADSGHTALQYPRPS